VYIGNTSPSADAHLFAEHSCQIPSQSDLKRRSLTLFEQQQEEEQQQQDVIGNVTIRLPLDTFEVIAPNRKLSALSLSF